MKGEYGDIADYAPIVLSADELAARARAWRDQQVLDSQWLVERHRDQLATADIATLTSDQYKALLAYRQGLRDWPRAKGFLPNQAAQLSLNGCLPPMSRDDLLCTAATRLAPLQDAADLGDVCDGDVARLTRGKQYRVALNRIEQQTGFPATVEWPTAPS